MGTYTVAVAICCMDQRLHEPEANIYRQFQEALGVDKVYLLAGAGPEGKILKGDEGHVSFIKDTQLIIDAKGASKVALCGHYDCAGHAVADEEHDRDVLEAAKRFAEMLTFDGEVVPFVAVPNNDGEGSTWALRRL